VRRRNHRSVPFAGDRASDRDSIVRVFVPYELTAPPCVVRTGWGSQTIFHNATDATQVVRFLGVSNGSARPNTQALTACASPDSTVTGNDLHWDPVGVRTLWVNDLTFLTASWWRAGWT